MAAGRKEVLVHAAPMGLLDTGSAVAGTKRAAPVAGAAKREHSDTVLPGSALARLARRHPDVARALRELAASGKVAGSCSGKISARVDPGVFAAAAMRFGLSESQVSEVINASLAVAAVPDTFKQWLHSDKKPLPDDFELAI